MIEREGEGCCDADGREEGVGASVVSGCDAPPVFEFGEQVLNFVARSVERLVVGERRFAASGWWDARFDASGRQRLPEPVAVIAPVGD